MSTMTLIQALEVISLSGAINPKSKVHLDAMEVACEVEEGVKGFVIAIAKSKDPAKMARASLRNFWSEYKLAK